MVAVVDGTARVRREEEGTLHLGHAELASIAIASAVVIGLVLGFILVYFMKRRWRRQSRDSTATHISAPRPGSFSAGLGEDRRLVKSWRWEPEAVGGGRKRYSRAPVLPEVEGMGVRKGSFGFGMGGFEYVPSRRYYEGDRERIARVRSKRSWIDEDALHGPRVGRSQSGLSWSGSFAWRRRSVGSVGAGRTPTLPRIEGEEDMLGSVSGTVIRRLSPVRLSPRRNSALYNLSNEQISPPPRAPLPFGLVPARRLPSLPVGAEGDEDLEGGGEDGDVEEPSTPRRPKTPPSGALHSILQGTAQRLETQGPRGKRRRVSDAGRFVAGEDRRENLERIRSLERLRAGHDAPGRRPSETSVLSDESVFVIGDDDDGEDMVMRGLQSPKRKVAVRTEVVDDKRDSLTSSVSSALSTLYSEDERSPPPQPSRDSPGADVELTEWERSRVEEVMREFGGAAAAGASFGTFGGRRSEAKTLTSVREVEAEVDGVLRDISGNSTPVRIPGLSLTSPSPTHTVPSSPLIPSSPLTPSARPAALDLSKRHTSPAFSSPEITPEHLRNLPSYLSPTGLKQVLPPPVQLRSGPVRPPTQLVETSQRHPSSSCTPATPTRRPLPELPASENRAPRRRADENGSPVPKDRRLTARLSAAPAAMSPLRFVSNASSAESEHSERNAAAVEANSACEIADTLARLESPPPLKTLPDTTNLSENTLTATVSELRRMNSLLSTASTATATDAHARRSASPTLPQLRGGGFSPNSSSREGRRNYLCLGSSPTSGKENGEGEKENARQGDDNVELRMPKLDFSNAGNISREQNGASHAYNHMYAVPAPSYARGVRFQTSDMRSARGDFRDELFKEGGAGLDSESVESLGLYDDEGFLKSSPRRGPERRVSEISVAKRRGSLRI